MPHHNNLYQSLLKKGYTKQQIHAAMHKFMLLQIQQDKATGCKHSALHKKPLLFARDSHFLKNLISKIVSLLKSQFAKKPKNPV